MEFFKVISFLVFVASVTSRPAQEKYNGRIVFFGDEIMANWRTEGSESWDRLNSDLYGSNLNTATTNQTTSSLIQFLADDKIGLEVLQPQVAVLLIGTNDIGQPATTTQAIFANIRRAMDILRAKAPTALIILFGLLPRRDPAEHERVQKINLKIYQMEYDFDITFMDLDSAFSDGSLGGINETLYLENGISLSAEGYQELYRAIRSQIWSYWYSPHEYTPYPNFVFMGDSILEQWSLVLSGRFEWSYMQSLGFMNLAVGGHDSRATLRRLTQEQIFTAMNPKVLMLMVGRTDLEAGATPNEVIKNARQIAQFVMTEYPHCGLILLGIPPKVGASDQELAAEKELNDGLSGLVYFTGLHFYNTTDLFYHANNGSLIVERFQEDGLHPNADGYMEILLRIADALNEYMSAPNQRAWSRN